MAEARDGQWPLGPCCPTPMGHRSVPCCHHPASRCVFCCPTCEERIILSFSFVIPMCWSEILTDSHDPKYGIIIGSPISYTHFPINTTDHSFYLHRHSSTFKAYTLRFSTKAGKNSTAIRVAARALIDEIDQEEVIDVKPLACATPPKSKLGTPPTRSPRGPAVTKPTNYTKLSKKITVGADNSINLSPYNPVVRETTKDFKPTNIQTKIVQV
jgi:hypothetical protein